MFKLINENKYCIGTMVAFILLTACFWAALNASANEPTKVDEPITLLTPIVNDYWFWLDAEDNLHVNTYDGESYSIDELIAVFKDAQGSKCPPVVQTPTELAILHLAPGIPTERLNTLAPLIIEHAELNNLDPLFVVAVIKQESNFNPDARGINLYEKQEDGSLKYVGYCCGLMQLHTMHGIKNVYDPEVNIAAGCAKLRKYIDEREGSSRRGLHRWGLTNYQAGQVLDRYVELLKLFNGEYELIEVIE